MNARKKIIVIADDFTGAAEIGGIGLRHGLRVAIETEPIDNNEVDLLIIATDTRSMPQEQAVQTIKMLVGQLMPFKPFLIYKKIDSVLRGNVSEEIEAQLDEMGLEQSIIIAGNPIFNRVIKNGRYYVDNVPLNETCFSTDSQHPLTTNEVLKVLSPTKKIPMYNKKVEDELPERGMIMGDVETVDDLYKWTLGYSRKVLFAGASGFFNSLLSSLEISKDSAHGKIEPFGESRLFVLGSSYPKDNKVLEDMLNHNHYQANMPKEIYYNQNHSDDVFNDWVEEVKGGLEKHKKVIVSSVHANSEDPDIFKRVKREVAELVKRVFEQVKIEELLVEGGSTTSEILCILDIKRLTPIQELDTGVIRMRVDSIPGLYLTTKPGSYTWPEKVWMQVLSEVQPVDKS